MSKSLKLKSILVSLLLGIVVLQGFWISDSYRERKSHLKTHIQSSVLHSINSYCIENEQINTNTISNISKQIKVELKNLNESLKFEIKIDSINNSILGKDISVYKIQCSKESKEKYLFFIPHSTKSYIINSILSWLLLSLLFIVLLFVFTGIYFRDISSNKQLQIMKDEFISNMTHELKTPISTISVASEILQNNYVNHDKEKVVKYSQMIFEENNRLKRLVDRVMQVGLFEEGRLTIIKEAADIHKIIDEAYKPLELVINKKNGSISTNYQIENPIVSIDTNHIRNVISNIIENAIKYSNSELSITISTYKKDNKVFVSIKDKGIGINKSDQKHIFNKYYRSNTISNSNKTGFGIGLFYVYQVMKAHSNSIKINSELNNGSEFILQFDLV